METETLLQADSDIALVTNYNNKVGNESFLHISRISEPKPPLSSLEGLLLRITFKDGSHEPVIKRLYTVETFPLKFVPDSYAFASHGIPASEFRNAMLKIRGVTLETTFCLYIYCDPKWKTAE